MLRQDKTAALARTRLPNSGAIPAHPGIRQPRDQRAPHLATAGHGYQVSVTELVGWEHSMKTSLSSPRIRLPAGVPRSACSPAPVPGLEAMGQRFFTP